MSLTCRVFFHTTIQLLTKQKDERTNYLTKVIKTQHCLECHLSTKEKPEVQTTSEWNHEKKKRRITQSLIFINKNLLTGGNVFNRFPSNHNSVRFGRDPTISGCIKKNQ